MSTPTRYALNLRFDKMPYLDPLLKFERASTATRINPQTGLIETVAANVPRLEKDGLLIEGAATNFLPHTTWNGLGNVPNGLDYAKNNSVAVSGEIPTLLSLGLPARHKHSGSGDNNVGSLIASVPAGPAVFSLWLWLRSDQSAAQYAGILPSIEGGGTTDFRWLTAPDLSKRDCWQRIAVAFISVGEPFLFVLRTSGTGIFYTQCWQLESSTAPTSYIPTNGALATRAADFCTAKLGSTFWNARNWTIAFDGDGMMGNGSNAFEISNGPADMSGAIAIWRGNPDSIVFYNNSKVVQPNYSDRRLRFAISQGDKWAVSPSGNDPIFSNAEPNNSNSTLQLGHHSGSDGHFNGHIRSLQILPYAVSDTVLQAMSALG